MDLIIKPTQKCNFCCKFCSSNKISSNGNCLLPLELIYAIIEKNNIETIIVNGGDPLMVNPQYYFKIINFLDNKKLKTSLSLTTNLWDFYLNPNKWIELFKNKRVGVTTSFQYGNERLIRKEYNDDDNQVFNETKFLKIIELFNKKIGYTPNFISVITNDNEDKAIDTVNLAKKINTECKLNPAVCSGRTTNHYPIWKAYKIYLDIIDRGLEKYEYNSKNLKNFLNGKNTSCPHCRHCWKNIRAISPEGLIHSCGSYNDDHFDNIILNRKTYELNQYDEKEILIDHKFLKKDCLQCTIYSLCNTCFKYMDDIRFSNTIEEHCCNMQKLKDRFEAL